MDSFRSSHVSRRSKFDRANASVLLLLLLPVDVDADADGFDCTLEAAAIAMRPATSSSDEATAAAGMLKGMFTKSAGNVVFLMM
jgi:hypothetical protein